MPFQQPHLKIACRFLLVLLPLLVFLPAAWQAQWIGIDDSFHLAQNDELTQGNWWSFWKAPYFSTYIPLTYTLWTFLYQWVQEPWAFHILNLFFHILSSLLVFSLIRKISGTGLGPAFLASLLFALHPLQTESVMWVSGFREILATFLALLALWFLVHDRIRFSWWLAGLFFLASLLAKPLAVLLPFLFLLLLVRRDSGSVRKKLIYTAGLLAVAAGVSLLTWFLQNETYSQSGAMSFELFRIVVALQSLGFYLQQFFWPLNLSPDYGRSLSFLIERGPQWLELLPGLACLLIPALMWNRMSGAVQVGSLWILLALVPNLGLIPFGFEEISVNADRYFYFAMAGASVLVACALPTGWSSRQSGIVSLVLIVLLGGLSFRQSRLWTDDPTLMSFILEKNPRSKMAAHNLGVYHDQAKDFEKAASFYKRALALEPQHLLSCSGLISSLVRLNRFQEAEIFVKQCLGDESLIRQYQGTVQLSALYGAGGHFLLKGPQNLIMAHQFFCESLKHHPGNSYSKEGLRQSEELLRQKALAFEACSQNTEL